MKSIWTFAVLALLGWITCVPALGAEAKEAKSKGSGPKAKFFENYDKNHNGIIDANEKEAIRKDYAEKPDGDLKRFDTNKDGKLDDEEIAAVKPPTGLGKSAGITAFFDKYDKNQNGVIDSDEREAIRKDYAAKPNGDLKKFDTNNDGTLSDEEISAITRSTGKKGGKKTTKAGAVTTEKSGGSDKSGGAATAEKSGAAGPAVKPEK
jgi:Ca2+-binding EF-hand superfamily protein